MTFLDIGVCFGKGEADSSILSGSTRFPRLSATSTTENKAWLRTRARQLLARTRQIGLTAVLGTFPPHPGK
jgi:hypothetical protein